MFDKTCETIPSCAVRVARSRERLCVCVSPSGSRPVRRVFPVEVSQVRTLSTPQYTTPSPSPPPLAPQHRATPDDSHSGTLQRRNPRTSVRGVGLTGWRVGWYNNDTKLLQ
eukprot:1185982-Prorocentrum_minimum.AAC.2